MIGLSELIRDNKYCSIALQFETYYQVNGKYVWSNKVNAWIDWIHDMWNNGQVNLSEYRFLVCIDVE